MNVQIRTDGELGWLERQVKNCCNKLQHVWPCFYCCCCKLVFFGVFAGFMSFLHLNYCIWTSLRRLFHITSLLFVGLQEFTPDGAKVASKKHATSPSVTTSSPSVFDLTHSDSPQSTPRPTHLERMPSSRLASPSVPVVVWRTSLRKRKLTSSPEKILEFLVDTSGFVCFKEAHALV